LNLEIYEMILIYFEKLCGKLGLTKMMMMTMTMVFILGLHFFHILIFFFLSKENVFFFLKKVIVSCDTYKKKKNIGWNPSFHLV
jgi:hypothetical protein